MTPQERERPLSPEAVMREKLIEAFGMVAAWKESQDKNCRTAKELRRDQRSLLEQNGEGR